MRISSTCFNRLRQNLGWAGALVSSILKSFGEFWSTFSKAQIFDRGYLGHFLSECHKILHGYGSWPIDISFPNFVNFDSGVRRCHAATCISPSLMHLLIYYLVFYMSKLLKLVHFTELLKIILCTSWKTVHDKTYDYLYAAVRVPYLS